MKGNFCHESSTVYIYNVHYICTSRMSHELVFTGAVCSQSLSAMQLSACIHKAYFHTEGTLDTSLHV